MNNCIILWTRQGFFFKFTSSHNRGKCSDLQSSDYGKCICEPPPPSHDLIIGPLCRTTSTHRSHKCSIKSLSPICHRKHFSKKMFSILYEARTIPFPRWKIIWRNRLKLVNKIVDWMTRPQCNVFELECSQLKPLWSLYHASLKLCVNLVNACKMHR